MLCAGCFDGFLKFYMMSGQQKSKDRELAFDPLCVSYFSSGEYITVSGTDRWAGLAQRAGREQGVCGGALKRTAASETDICAGLAVRRPGGSTQGAMA